MTRRLPHFRRLRTTNLCFLVKDNEHGRRKDFSRGRPVGDFPKILSGGAKRGEIWFLPLESEKTTFFANNFKIQGGQGPPAPLPTPMSRRVSRKYL